MIELSADEEINLCPSLEKETPLIVCLWSYSEIKLDLSAISQIRISPSWDPDIILFKASGHLASTLIPSEWPYRLPMNGFAKILFNFVALKARWNSRARENGCSALGVLVTAEVGSWVIVKILTIVDRQL